MREIFAALRFAWDKNLADKIYWYRSDFPLKEGEEVFAPVGMRDRIQKATVEKVLFGEPDPAPYDMRLLKSVAAPASRPVEAVRDFGGHRIDDRHYTRFGKIYLCPSRDMLPAEFEGYMQFEAPMSETDAVICAILKGRPVVLLGEEGREFARELLRLARGEEGSLRERGVSQYTLAALAVCLA